MLSEDVIYEIAVASENQEVLQLLSSESLVIYSFRYPRYLYHAVKQLIMRGSLDELVYVADKHESFEFFPWMMVVALESGNLEMIKYLQSNHVAFPPDPIGTAFAHGHRHLLEFLSGLGYIPTEHSIEQVSREGRVIELEHLTRLGAIPSERAIVSTILGPMSDEDVLIIINYLLDSFQLDFQSIADEAIKAAIERRRPMVVRRLHQMGAPVDSTTVMTAIYEPTSREIVEFLLLRDPDLFRENLKHVINACNLPILRLVIEHLGITSEQLNEELDLAYIFDRCSDLEYFKYLYRHGVPYPRVVSYSPSLNVVMYHHQLGIPLDNRLINAALDDDNHEVYQYALEHGQHPNTYAYQLYLLRNERLDEMKHIDWDYLEYIIRHVGDKLKKAMLVHQRDIVMEVLERILSGKPSLTDREVEAVIQTAAQYGRLDVIKAILERRQRLNQAQQAQRLQQLYQPTDYDEYYFREMVNPVVMAAAGGHLRTVRYLMESTAYSQLDIVLDGSTGFNAHLTVIHYLISRGLRGRAFEHVMNAAKDKGYLDIVRKLHSAGVAIVDLVSAAHGGHLSVIKLGYEQWKCSMSLLVGLTNAISNNRPTTVMYLLEHIDFARLNDKLYRYGLRVPFKELYIKVRTSSKQFDEITDFIKNEYGIDVLWSITWRYIENLLDSVNRAPKSLRRMVDDYISA